MENQADTEISNPITAKISDFCNKKRNEMIYLLQKLVSTPSYSGKESEYEVARLIKNKLEDCSIRSILDDRNGIVTIRATLGYAPDGLLLTAPISTTPIADIKKWHYNPFEGFIDNDKMYGRGAANSKSGIVSMIYALLALKEIQDEKNIRIELLFHGGEHNGYHQGIHNILTREFPVSGGILGHSGEPNEISIGARGYHRYKFVTKGIPVHTGSKSAVGINAINKMIRLIEELEKTKMPKKDEGMFDFGSNLTFYMIEGGRAIDVVPDECMAKLDIRTTPGQTKNDADNMIRETIQKLKTLDPNFEIKWNYLGGEEGYILQGNEKILTSLKKTLSAEKGYPPKIVVSGPAHVGNVLYKKNIPLIVCGPEGGNAHSYNEWVYIDSVPRYAAIYTLTALDYFNLV